MAAGEFSLPGRGRLCWRGELEMRESSLLPIEGEQAAGGLGGAELWRY